jgi:hypothetical protein
LLDTTIWIVLDRKWCRCKLHRAMHFEEVLQLPSFAGFRL